MFFTELDFLRETSRWRLSENKSLWFNCKCGSTMVLPEGTYPWFSWERVLDNRARTLFDRLALREFPYVSEVTMRLLPTLEDESLTSETLAREIRKHPVVMAEVLRVAQQRAGVVAFRFQSLAQAISFLGRRALRELLFIAELGSVQVETRVFRPAAFWDEMLSVGWIAEALARRFVPTLSPDDVFLAGALANVGKIVLAHQYPAKADAVTVLAQERAWRTAELMEGAPEHTTLGEVVAMLWGLPPEVRAVAATHHQHAFAKGHQLQEIVSFAVQVSHVVGNRPHRIEPRLLERHKQAFALDGIGFAELCKSLESMRVAAALNATDLILADQFHESAEKHSHSD